MRHRRSPQIDRTQQLITADPDVMGGLAVFTGTRVPVETVLTSLEKGLARTRLLELFPALTDEHIEAGKLYMDVHRRRGRPSKAWRAPTSWKIKSSRRVAGITRAQTSLAPWDSLGRLCGTPKCQLKPTFPKVSFRLQSQKLSIDDIGEDMIIRTPLELGATIKDCRRRLHLGQHDLAAKVGVSRQWVIDVEKGKPGTEIGLIFRALAVLGITLHVGEGAPPAKKTAADVADIDTIIAKARRPRK
jgi:HTH-type transcriptional regulator/antitoxin HipB